MNNSTLRNFISYCQTHIKGDEKGEAHIFLDHFFVALGYEDGLKGAGADCEFRMHNPDAKTTSFADLVWPKRVLIEMKKKNEKLENHLQQAASYWMKLAGNRPRYIILCNFYEFWIYDFDKDIYHPADVVRLEELADRIEAFSFLFPKPKAPVFGIDREDVTEKAAEMVAAVFKSLVKRKVEREVALRYCLQCVITMFAEDTGLLPDSIFTRLIEECTEEKANSYDLIGGLFREMNEEGITPSGRYQGVDYFNGGLFEKVHPLELRDYEIEMLRFAAMRNWRHVNPAIFGSIFEKALETEERHKLGAHYTHEIDIKKIVDPVIVQPWMEKIEAADSMEEYMALLEELSRFRVLDPACGSGNFLFIAFKEMKMLERRLLSLLRESVKNKDDMQQLKHFLSSYDFVNTGQFYGIDIKPFAVELARVTLMVAKEIAFFENKEHYDNKYKPLPLDNLSENIICADALLDENDQPRVWPEVEAIIGNPPFQARSKMLSEFGGEYLNRLWNAYPEMNKYADFCTYWFNKSHHHLKENHFAGLVGTDSIRENNSRENSLDYIIKNEGVIFNAVSSETWSGEAAVKVSIVNWKKGVFNGKKVLFSIDIDNSLKANEIEYINSSLSLQFDVTGAKRLKGSLMPKKCFKGQKHGHPGFLLKNLIAEKILKTDHKCNDVLKPYLIGDELVSILNCQPSRFVIDFSQMDINQASTYKVLFSIIEKTVLPKRKDDAEKEIERNNQLLKNNQKARLSKSYQQYYKSWWQLIGKREDLLLNLTKLNRYIACSEVSLRPIFEFISTEIRPNATLNVFTFDDDYSFGVIQSKHHWLWWTNKCSTLGGTYRYTNESVWDTFPWPQNPSIEQIRKVAKAANALRDERNKIMREYKMSLRDLYRLVEKPGKNPVRDLHETLDHAVMEAYGFSKEKDILEQLLELNLSLAAKEENGEKVQAPGLPEWVEHKEEFVSEDCVRFEWGGDWVIK